MTRPATITLAPGGESFTCGPGETILRAGLAAGFAMPYECASGSCSSCKGRLLEGTVDSLWADATGLSERDRRKGDRILCCQARPLGDCTVQVRLGQVEGAREEPAPSPFTATVETLRAARAGRHRLRLPAGAARALPPRPVRAASGAGRRAPCLLDGQHRGGNAGVHREGEAGRPRLALPLRGTRRGRHGEPGGALRPGLSAHAAGARDRLRRRRLRARADALGRARRHRRARCSGRAPLLRRQQRGRALHGRRDAGARRRSRPALAHARGPGRRDRGRPPASSATSRSRRWRGSPSATSTWPGRRG